MLLAFARIEVGIAVVSYALMYLYPELPFWYVWLFDLLDAKHSPEAVWWVSVVVAGLVMTPPAVLMGMHFPIAVRAVVGHEERLGGPVGLRVRCEHARRCARRVPRWVRAAADVVGAGHDVHGRAGRSSWLRRCSIVHRHTWRPTTGRPVCRWGSWPLRSRLLFVAQRPPWDPMLMTAGLYHYVSHFDDHSREGILHYTGPRTTCSTTRRVCPRS